MLDENFKKGCTHNQANNIDPQQLVRMLFFIELINAGSITKAAETLNISTSTGSRWLNDLELDLGISLYQRNNPNERLTEAGNFLYSKFSEITDDINLMINELTHFTTETRGNIRVCCTPIYAENVVMPIVSEFLEDNPLVNVQLTVTPRGMEHYKDHDFIISAISGNAKSKDADLLLVRRNLLTQKFITVASPEYIRKNGEPLVLDELRNHRCLYSKALQNQNVWIYKDNNEAVPIKLEKYVELSDAKMMLSACLRSSGITYLPEFIVTRHINEGRLVRLLPDYDTDDWFLNIYYLPQRFMTHSTKLFKDFLLSRNREKINEMK
ncbi:LysR family transcriptional regulator [Agarivorans sp. QJM3NY_25]|uniref:LysR family transcriptional regulator n=1 Tax=Agarivorans sp. QJM3NY_25 TaxID=3421430 RepID=UPI003D7D9243